MASGLRYPKSARLRTRTEYQAVLRRGEVYPGRECLVRRLANERAGPRLGISTPRRYGNAIRRNRFRRLVREVFRNLGDTLGPYDFLVSPRKSLEEPTYEGLRNDLASVEERRPAPPRAPRGPKR